MIIERNIRPSCSEWDIELDDYQFDFDDTYEEDIKNAKKSVAEVKEWDS